MPDQIPLYDATSPAGIAHAVRDVSDALSSVPHDFVDTEIEHDIDELLTAADKGWANPDFDIPEDNQLIGIPSEVYAQIRAALKSGKQHLMFYGPPGTGKTSLAQYVANILFPSSVTVTGSADWSSQDVIGGYQPMPQGGLRFVPGVLLENFDKPVIIDELNRCDIDRVLGPLFTVLSGQSTTLPYLVDPKDHTSARYVILPVQKPDVLPHEFAPTRNWRILATINSIDKASLYQISYALSRRFGWIFVDVPPDLSGFVRDFCIMRGIIEEVPDNAPVPLADMWGAVNGVRSMGAAPFIDVINFCAASLPDFNFFAPPTLENQDVYLSAFSVFVMPMLDGIAHEEAKKVAVGVATALGLDENKATVLDRKLSTVTL